MNDCTSLAGGAFIRDALYPMPTKGPLCPDPNDAAKEDLFKPELVQCNADSITLISSARSPLLGPLP